MARLLRDGRGVAVGDLRAALAEHLRTERSPHAARRLALLDAGEPVDVPGWVLWRWAPQWRRERLVRVEPDGTVTPVVR